MNPDISIIRSKPLKVDDKRALFKEDGFTLIEVLVAIVILAISLSIFGYLAGSIQLLETSKVETQAVGFGKEYLDIIRSSWAMDSEYLAVTLPFRTPPKGYGYTVRVEDGNSGTLITEYTYDPASPPPITANNSSFRRITITLSKTQATPITLEAEITRPRLR